MNSLDKVACFVISGTDRSRDSFMEAQIQRAGLNNVAWLTGPNKPDVPVDLLRSLKSRGSLMTEGEFSVTLKHFLALHRFLQSDGSWGLIMEDNIEFRGDFGHRLERYLELLPKKFDLLFDGDLMKLPGKETEYAAIGSETFSLKRMRRGVTRWSHGATNGANCYLVSRQAAKRIVRDFLPFDRVIDHHLNEIIRRERLVVYWPLPPAVHKVPRPSSVYFDSDGNSAQRI